MDGFKSNSSLNAVYSSISGLAGDANTIMVVWWMRISELVDLRERGKFD